MKTRINALIGTSLVGLAISIYQSAIFYNLRDGSGGFKSACNLGHAANCDIIMASRYAELFWGIPLSSAAAGWFVALFAVAFFARNPFWRRDSLRVAAAMTGFSAILSLVYLGVMVGVLHSVCIFCLTVDLCTWTALILVMSMSSEWRSPVKPEMTKLKTLGGIGGACFLVTVGLLKTLDTAAIPAAELEKHVTRILSSPVMAVDTGPEHPSFGPKDAPVTIVEFSDFQCPYCRVGAMTLKGVLDRYPTQVRVVFRAYPLDPSCNSMVQHSMHPVACDAARTAFCAIQQGKFENVYEYFFEHQSDFSTTGEGLPAQMAAKAGVDPNALSSCTGSPAIQTAIAKDIEDGNHLGVQSTPTFFLNGHKIEGVYPVPAWNAMIDRILAGGK
jgi:protein-disulfide isomerase